jgi:serine/threonine-protein kinase
MPIQQFSSAVDEASLIGTNLDDRYRLLEAIGDGGMGRVFRAEQLATGETVALKLLHAEFSGVAEVVRRFEREAEITTHFSHPHIAKTIELGKWDGRLYIAMEFLAGTSLADLLDADPHKNGGRLSVKRTIAIMRPVLDALDYAHGLGVVHRDLKPENIMIVPARGFFSFECVKLLDFGIAKLEEDGPLPGRKLTQVGLLLGTPGYMSPEQAVGQRADVRSDLYSCGVLLYEMLAGRRPFEANSSLEVLGMHVNATPKSLRESAGEASIPPAVEGVVMRALAKRPEERFQSARELRDALGRVSSRRNGDAVISGTEKTIFAMPPASRSRGGWMRSATILVAMALLIAGHLGPAGLPVGRASTSAGTSDTGNGRGREGGRDESNGNAERHRRQSGPGNAQHSHKVKKYTPKKSRRTG